MERLRRLWQPQNPLFWMMLGFNALSSACTWILRSQPLNLFGLLLIGTGRARWGLPAELLSAFATHKISAETSQTGQAANTYNILLEEGRRVAAALIAVD